MISRLTVVFFIVLCLLAGFVLVIFPWVSVGRVGDWGDNQLLLFVSNKLNLQDLQKFVASGWVRGGVTGLGIVNLIVGFWEIANFKQSVERLEGKQLRRES